MTLRATDQGLTTDIAAALRTAGVSGVDDSALARSLYSSDASLYRVEPHVVTTPAHVDELDAVVQVCREASVPLTMRGAGTSVAGNAIGPGVVVDTSKYLNQVVSLDLDTGSAVVEPGIIHAQLQHALTGSGWRFGPDPSTHTRCTIGGMIGNNACGNRALGYGRTADNVLGLELIAGTGDLFTTGVLPGHQPHEPEPVAGLRSLIERNLATVRTEFGQFTRQVSGYCLEHVLPENDFELHRMMVGSEGTLAVVKRAHIALVKDAPVRLLVMLGYANMYEAADDVPNVLPHKPIACEGMDARIVEIVTSRRGASAVPPLPRGAGWLMVELAGDDVSALTSAASSLVNDVNAIDSAVVTEPGAMRALWKIREDGAGLAGRTPDGQPAHAGWEDAAVPPAHLGAYLREFDAVMDEYNLTGLPYGHFGDGCLHIRIDFPFHTPGGTNTFNDFLHAAGRVAAAHGGSMSGEHGDGRARSELLPLMYSAQAVALFGATKALFDPQGVLNPGVLVDPDPAAANLRVANATPLTLRELPTLAMKYRHDDGDMSQALHRCTGVGKCRAAGTPSTVMCPSYQATTDEKDSTRGRARVLQDVVTGHRDWDDPAVDDALDLCLACKGCARDCPTGIDMATYKAEALHQKYRGKLRPLSHYALGRLPKVAAVVTKSPQVASVVRSMMAFHVLGPIIAAMSGTDKRRGLPSFAKVSARGWFDQTYPSGTALSTAGRTVGTVVLFVDTFDNAFSPEIATSAVNVLTRAGYDVTFTEKNVCCGLTQISTGQLDGARSDLSQTITELDRYVRDGALVVGLEPSCTAVVRGDAAELLDDDQLDAVQRVSAATKTLAEILLSTPGYELPDLSGVTGVAQPHCHHHAVMGWEDDAALLQQAGASVDRVGGCCGLAGNFGVEKGHYEMSVAVANQQLLPAVEACSPGDVVLADGFSCRTQLYDLADTAGVHLAQLLDQASSPPSEPTSSIT